MGSALGLDISMGMIYRSLKGEARISIGRGISNVLLRTV